MRERETRRVADIEPDGGETVLRVEDFFGHEQYGIASGRPLRPKTAGSRFSDNSSCGLESLRFRSSRLHVRKRTDGQPSRKRALRLHRSMRAQAAGAERPGER